MNPLENFKNSISSRYFPRHGIFLFLFLCCIAFLIVGAVHLQMLYIFNNMAHNSYSTSIKFSVNNKVNYIINLNLNNDSINQLLWGVNAPDKHLLWAGNKTLEQRIKNARIKIIRVGAIQYANYALGHSMCMSPTSCNFSAMDACLKTIFDAGAEPLFVVVAYPGGISQYTWQSYAVFMKQVVTRYNIDLVLGKKIRYWEMWNEPTDEPDGTIPNQQLYGEFIKTVGSAMKLVDPTINLIASAAPYADLGPGGWLNYVAQNTNDLIDVLSWHDYGSHDMNDQTRLTEITSKYYNNIRAIAGSKNFVNPTGKQYGAAITEYNMAGQPLANRNMALFHSSYNAVYVASAILNAMKAKAVLFTFFTLAQSGTNLLGILDPTNNNYSPFKPYYSFYMFGNHMGTTLLNSPGDDNLFEYVASKSADGSTVYILVINKNVNSAQSINVKISNASSGNYKVYELDANVNPLGGLNRSYRSGQFTYTLPPLSVTAFEIPLPQILSAAFSPAPINIPLPFSDSNRLLQPMVETKQKR